MTAHGDHGDQKNNLNHGKHGMHGNGKHEGLLHEDETYAIRGACFDVYQEVGAGFHEGVYQECLEIEFLARKIPFVAQQTLDIDYKGQTLKHHFQPDFICCGKIIVEIKAVHEILPEHQSQAFNYLKASGMRLALLINFGHHPKVEIQRIVI